MGDADQTSPTKPHSYFKQFKRKAANGIDFKGAGVAPKEKNANIKGTPNDNNRNKNVNNVNIKDAGGAAQISNTNDNTNMDGPSTGSTVESTRQQRHNNSTSPTVPTEGDLGIIFDEEIELEVEMPETRTNAVNELIPPSYEENYDISDEELEHHLSHLERASIQTIIHSGLNGRNPAETVGQHRRWNERERGQDQWDDRERERLVFKLDNLNDKKCRYVSHESFLKKCLDHNLIPNGLKVFVEPSIGNRNDEFLTGWHELLDQFSRTLTTKVIEFCGTEVTNTENEMSEIAERLQTITTTAEFNKVVATVATNEKSRTNELTARKNRKFYRLRYNNNTPNNRNEERANDTRRPDRGGDNRRRNNDNRRREARSDRSGSEYNSTSETDQSDQEDRLLAVIERRNNNGNRNNAQRNESQRNERQIATSERQPRNQRPTGRPVGINEQRSYASAVRDDSRPGPSTDHHYDSRREPIHERINLSRRNSRKNVNLAQRRDEPRQADPREEELESLRSKVRFYEAQTNQTSTSTPSQPPKNVEPARRETGQNQNELSSFRNYLAGVMDAIKEFDNRLSNQQGQPPIPSDRS